jgi:hypothetical protein
MRNPTEIQADLDAAYASRRKALDVEEYTIDSGQGRQTVRRSLVNIERTIRVLESELNESTNSGPVFLQLAR